MDVVLSNADVTAETSLSDMVQIANALSAVTVVPEENTEEVMVSRSVC